MSRLRLVNVRAELGSSSAGAWDRIDSCGLAFHLGLDDSDVFEHLADHSLVERAPLLLSGAHQCSSSAEAWIDSHQSIGEEAIFSPGTVVASALLGVDSNSRDLDVSVQFLAHSGEIFERVLAPAGVSNSGTRVRDDDQLAALVVSRVEQSWDEREHLREAGRFLVCLVSGN